MSTIKVDNIRIASESVSRPVTGVAAAYCQFKTSPSTSIRASSNISSLLDNGVGDTNVYYTDDMASNNYTVSAVSNSSNLRETNNGHLADRCQILTASPTNVSEDSTTVNVIVVGDLA
jgi:hypothetical protein